MGIPEHDRDKLTASADLPDVPWRVTLSYQLFQGKMFLVEVVIGVIAARAHEGIDSGKRVLQRARLTALETALENWLRNEFGPQWLPSNAWRTAAFGGKRPGRAGQGDLFLADWVRLYVEACASSRTPVKDLAEQHPGHSEAMIRSYLGRARKAELLGNPEKGKSGGEMTSKCKQLLANAAQVAAAVGIVDDKRRPSPSRSPRRKKVG